MSWEPINGTMERRTKVALERLEVDDVESNLSEEQRDHYERVAASGQALMALNALMREMCEQQRLTKQLVAIAQRSQEMHGENAAVAREIREEVKRGDAVLRGAAWVQSNPEKGVPALIGAATGVGVAIWQAFG